MPKSLLFVVAAEDKLGREETEKASSLFLSTDIRQLLVQSKSEGSDLTFKAEREGAIEIERERERAEIP